MNSDALFTAAHIRELLGADFFKRIEVFGTIDSTNAYARKLPAADAPALIVAEEQTKGRGRFGRRWESERSKNLTFSLFVAPHVARDRLGLLPLCVAQSIAAAIEQQTGLGIATKWPNDLLVDGKKLCGILLEGAGRKSAWMVVGIGLNVNQDRFLPGLNATSLSLALGKPVDRLSLLASILRNLAWLHGSETSRHLADLLSGWKARCVMWGKKVRVESGKSLTGIAKDVTDDGALLVAVDGVLQKVHAGDVTIMIP